MTFRPRRSVLYMPGANDRALEKAKTLDADALILDLEDSVAPEAKADARARVAAAVKAQGYGRRELVIRINGLDTPWGADDMAAAAAAGPDAILVPKVSRGADVAHAVLLMKDAPSHTRLWVMMETPLAILKAEEIAGAERRLACLVLGTNDLVKETRASAGQERFALLPMLSGCVLAARAHGLDVIDGVFNDFRDEVGFRAECQQGRLLGMDGKTLIHPGQIAACNDVFSPSADEVAWAQKIIAAFRLPENAAKGVITVEGKMVERLHLAMAERVAAIADNLGL
jgi:citrate lyase subunit beta / citryl-CoA lyase